MYYQISHPAKKIATELTLPASKSISNRLLIIRALTEKPFKIINLSESDDTCVLRNALNTPLKQINIGHAGTAMRFLTAFLAITPGNWVLAGSQRMHNRPIGILVDALRELGADISYANKEGFPPLKIKGKKINGGKIAIQGNISSQFISALLMIAPKMKNGLDLEIVGKSISTPYIDLTINLMRYFGADIFWQENGIKIFPKPYQPKEIKVEADWSAASYWYEIAALSQGAEIVICGLSADSLQGDAAVADLFNKLGVQTIFQENAVQLIKRDVHTHNLSFVYDFTGQPDLTQTLAVTLSLLGIPFRFSGVESLKIKETDRIFALINELEKLGVHIHEPAHGELSGNNTNPGYAIDLNRIPEISTYQDHRMAMAFAPSALFYDSILIQDPLVVSKSYPQFWEDLKMAGFSIQQKK